MLKSNQLNVVAKVTEK